MEFNEDKQSSVFNICALDMNTKRIFVDVNVTTG